MWFWEEQVLFTKHYNVDVLELSFLPDLGVIHVLEDMLILALN